MTTGEVARALGVATTTVQRWVHKYGLRPAQVTLGGHFRWDLDDLKAQLRELQDPDGT
jgi:excisionase family DNA binding protein